MQYTLTGVSRNDGQYGRTIQFSAKGLDGTVIPKATIYEKQKDGTSFPGFDSIGDGSVIEANAWTNPKGYVTFFPPKPNAPKGGGNRGAQMEKAMERKEAGITKFQESKETGIMLSSTIRMATDIVCSMNTDGKMTPAAIRAGIQEWRRWLWFQWEKPLEYPPFENKVAGTDVPYPTEINPDDIPF